MDQEQQALKAELEGLEKRLEVFLEKLAEKAGILFEGVIAEAPGLMAADDMFRQTWHRFRSGIQGQLRQMQDKAVKVRDEQITGTYVRYSYQFTMNPAAAGVLTDWRERCLARIDQWEAQLQEQTAKVFEQVETQHLEQEYQQLLAAYRAEKEKVHCRQCGAPLSIDKLYMITAYVRCNFCQTQNIFEPGTAARSIAHMARSLAEYRCRALLIAYEQAREAAMDSAPVLHEKYWQAVLNEIHKIKNVHFK